MTAKGSSFVNPNLAAWALGYGNLKTLATPVRGRGGGREGRRSDLSHL